MEVGHERVAHAEGVARREAEGGRAPDGRVTVGVLAVCEAAQQHLEALALAERLQLALGGERARAAEDLDAAAKLAAPGSKERETIEAELEDLRACAAPMNAAALRARGGGRRRTGRGRSAGRALPRRAGHR